VLLVQRRNIDSGTTTIHGLDREPLGAFTLTHPFDAALVDEFPCLPRRDVGIAARLGRSRRFATCWS